MWGGEWPLHHNARKYWFTHFTADMQRSTTADVEEKVGVGGGALDPAATAFGLL